MRTLRGGWMDWAVGALCAGAAALALHAGLSAAAFRAEREHWRKERAWIVALERGDPASWAWRQRIERSGGAHPADAAAAVSETAGGDVARESLSSTPLGGGWSRLECTLRVRDADFGAVARALEELSAGDPAWHLRSGDWTPGPAAGRGEALLVLEALDYAGGAQGAGNER